MNAAARSEIEQVVRRIEKIETAVEPRFQDHFVAAMALPHATDPFPNLAAAVALPPRTAADDTAQGEAGQRRRRRRGA